MEDAVGGLAGTGTVRVRLIAFLAQSGQVVGEAVDGELVVAHTAASVAQNRD